MFATVTPHRSCVAGFLALGTAPRRYWSVLASTMLALWMSSTSVAQDRTLLAIGAHAGDVELTSGAVLAQHARMGDRAVILHLTLGEGGHPGLPADEYADQKRREADEAARHLGAEAIFGPYRDGELPDDEEVRRFVARIIREVKPTHIITHAPESIHKDHARTHAIVSDAVLLAALPAIDLGPPAHRGVRGVYFAENWEDRDDFEPYVYVDVSDAEEAWREAVRSYEFVRGGISSFPYLQYYEALQSLRGAEARTDRAVSFDIGDMGKRRVIGELP